MSPLLPCNPSPLCDPHTPVPHTASNPPWPFDANARPLRCLGTCLHWTSVFFNCAIIWCVLFFISDDGYFSCCQFYGYISCTVWSCFACRRPLPPPQRTLDPLTQPKHPFPDTIPIQTPTPIFRVCMYVVDCFKRNEQFWVGVFEQNFGHMSFKFLRWPTDKWNKLFQFVFFVSRNRTILATAK